MFNSTRIWILPLALALICSIESIAGFVTAPPGSSWTAILPRNTADVNGYLGIIEETRQGHLLAHNLFTAEPHPGFQIRPYYMMLGLIGRVVPQVSTVTLMEIGRFVSSFCFLLLLALIAKRLFESNRDRILAVLVLAFASGLGWTRLVQDPPDLRIVEFSNFLAIISPPLYTAALSLIAGIFLLLDRAWRSATVGEVLRFSIPAAFLGLWLGLDRPFSTATLVIAVGCCLLGDVIRNKKLNTQSLAAVLPLFIGIFLALSYQYFSVRRIPVYAAWNHQHVLPTPAIPQLVISLGLLIPIALYGLFLLRRRAPQFANLLGFYALAAVLLSHFPIQFQERFWEGLPICVSILASCAVVAMLNQFRNAGWVIGAVAIVGVLIISDVIVVRRDLNAIVLHQPPQYIPDQLVDGLQEMKKLVNADEAVLSAESSGNFIVGYAARRVVLGHKVATANYEEKWKLVRRILTTPATDASKLIKQSGATWLFWGPEERAVSRGVFNPNAAPYLMKEYDNTIVILYKIKM